MSAICQKSINNHKTKDCLSSNAKQRKLTFLIIVFSYKMEDQKSQKVFRKQPILCPWITSQPYHSSLWNKNRSAVNSADPSTANRFLTSPWNTNRQMSMGITRVHDKSLPSIQQSSSQFFYFLRLMQLFPDTHPATLHTVLALCKNDFFCAVDKLLYAKRCKLLCYKKNMVKKSPQNRKCICNNHNSSERGTKNDLKQSCSTSAATVTLNLTVNDKRSANEETAPIVQHELSEPVHSFNENAEDLSAIKNIAVVGETQSSK